MIRSRVFVTRRIADAALSRLQAAVELEVWDGAMPPSPEVLRARVKAVDAHVVNPEVL